MDFLLAKYFWGQDNKYGDETVRTVCISNLPVSPDKPGTRFKAFRPMRLLQGE
jgi:hypothetical protein